MKFHRKTFAAATAVKKIKNGTLDLAPEYQRGSVWTRSRKALLIDSVLRGYDLPKLYLRESPGQTDAYEVVDGVQRLTAFFDFMNDHVPLPKDSEFPNFRYSQLADNIQDKIDDYQLDFTVLEGFGDDDVRDMFLRLQNGVRLNAAEELKAVSGDMHDFVEQLLATDFFTRATAFSSSRGANRQVAAQIAKLVLEGIGDARKEDLKAFYRNHTIWKITERARQLRAFLNWISPQLETNDPLLRNRAQTVSISVGLFEIWKSYAISEHGEKVIDLLRAFDLAVLSGDEDFEPYSTAMSHSSDQGKSIELRHEFVIAALRPIADFAETKDPKRSFSESQKVMAWYRSSGKCAVEGCANPVTFKTFHADHQKAWSRGGKSLIENLQVLCPQHNLSKGKS
jgi:hypothetical protein